MLIFISICGTAPELLKNAKDKSAFDIEKKWQLVQLVEALRQALAVGELGPQIAAAGTEIGDRFLKPF
jgi:hypothetical protein